VSFVSYLAAARQACYIQPRNFLLAVARPADPLLHMFVRVRRSFLQPTPELLLLEPLVPVLVHNMFRKFAVLVVDKMILVARLCSMFVNRSSYIFYTMQKC